MGEATLRSLWKQQFIEGLVIELHEIADEFENLSTSWVSQTSGAPFDVSPVFLRRCIASETVSLGHIRHG